MTGSDRSWIRPWSWSRTRPIRSSCRSTWRSRRTRNGWPTRSRSCSPSGGRARTNESVVMHQMVETLAKTLREEDRSQEANELLAAYAMQNDDLYVRLNWQGDAGFDCVVDEPFEATAQYSASNRFGRLDRQERVRLPPRRHLRLPGPSMGSMRSASKPSTTIRRSRPGESHPGDHHARRRGQVKGHAYDYPQRDRVGSYHREARGRPSTKPPSHSSLRRTWCRIRWPTPMNCSTRARIHRPPRPAQGDQARHALRNAEPECLACSAWKRGLTPIHGNSASRWKVGGSSRPQWQRAGQFFGRADKSRTVSRVDVQIAYRMQGLGNIGVASVVPSTFAA